MPIDWNHVRYRGDAKDVAEMQNTYHVEDYLATSEENRKNMDQGVREQFLKKGIRLTERLSPRIYGIYDDVSRRLEIPFEAEVFCLPSNTVNAYAVLEVRQKQRYFMIGLTAAALEMLDDGELKSIVGHELGHFLFGHNRMNALITLDQFGNPAGTVLPPLGDSLFFRWQKKAEISVDRAGLLASGDFAASSTSLLKATFGLSEKNLNIDIDALLGQVEEIKDRPEMMEEVFASHPLLPIRLKALRLFAQSGKAKRAGFPVKGRALSDKRLEDGVDELMELTRRHPRKPLDEAIMKVIALGGALVLGADGDVTDPEVKVLLRILHQWFTDEPEEQIVTSRKEIEKRLPNAAKVIRKEGDPPHKNFVLSRLADVALADGSLLDAEGSKILEIAEMMGIPSKTAYSILVQAAHQSTDRSDVRLNRMATELRTQLTKGFR